MPCRQDHTLRSTEGHHGARLHLSVVEVERLAYGHGLLNPVLNKNEAEQHRHEQSRYKDGKGASGGEKPKGRAANVTGDHSRKGAQLAKECGDREEKSEHSRCDALAEEGDQPDEPACRARQEGDCVGGFRGGRASCPASVGAIAGGSGRQGVIARESGHLVSC